MEYDSALEIFTLNVGSVDKLMSFDREVQELAIESVEKLHQKLVDVQKITNPKLNGERTLEILRSIRNSPVLKERYSIIYNQAVVLLVSYFGSALGDIFRFAAAYSLSRNDERVVNVEFKVRMADILSIAESPEQGIGDLLILKDDISFQDMQSTHRAFNKYFDVNIEPDESVKNIITAQACRNAIVHDGARVNQRTIKQLRNVNPRTLKNEMELGESIIFSIEEVEVVKVGMLSYMSSLVTILKNMKI